jgi:hypothetical protein
MASTLRVTGCRVNTSSITLSFSEAVDQTTSLTAPTNPPSTNATNLANYSIFAPNSGFNPAQSPTGWEPSVLPDGSTVELSVSGVPAVPTVIFSPGEWVQITVSNIGLASAAGTSAMPTPQQISGRVPNEAARTTRDIEDAISYPVLTEEIGYRPSPVGSPTSGGGGGSLPSAGGGANLGQVALRAVGDVLGWKPNSDDPKGFIGALTQSFTLTDVEGHVESKWMPRTFAVQTDLGGGVTGAQASLYMRAKDALEQSLSLLDGLYPLDPDADPEYVKALREMARSQMSQIVKEFGTVGLPSILRIDTYFDILLGQHPTRGFTTVQFDPDKIKGTLGKLRDTYGIYFRGNPFNNSVEDEQDITNFRVISDYMTSLMQSWIANREYFVVAPNKLAFFGTQLVLISRQLNVIAETVNEVRFTLDSVFIGPNERQSLLLEFKDNYLPPMFLEDMLVEIENFVTNEGPQLLRDGGKISVTNNILPVVRELRNLVVQAHDPANRSKIPDGFRTIRVRRSLDDLRDQLGELIRLVTQVEQQLPIPEYALTISGVIVTSGPDDNDEDASITWDFSIYGSAFDPAIGVSVHSSVAEGTQCEVNFLSAERIDVCFTLPADFTQGNHDIVVCNPDGESATLSGGLNYSGSSLVATTSKGGGGGSGDRGYAGVSNFAATGVAAQRVGKSPRPFTAAVNGVDVSAASSSAGAKTPPSAPSGTAASTTTSAAVSTPAPAQKLQQVTGNEEQIDIPASKTEATAITTKEQLAESLKQIHPTFWEKFKHEF